MSRGTFSVPCGHPALAGHFPGDPLVPGVVLLEQLLNALEKDHRLEWPLTLQRVKFLAPVRPDENLEVFIDTGSRRHARLSLRRVGQPVLEAVVAWSE